MNGVATNAYTYYDHICLRDRKHLLWRSDVYCCSNQRLHGNDQLHDDAFVLRPGGAAVDCNIFDAANVVEVNSAGTPGTNGGLWGIPGTTTIATGQTLTTWSASALTNTGGFNGGIAIDAWRGYTAILTGGGCSSSYAATDIYANSTTVLSVDPQTGCTPNASSTFKVLSATATTDGTHPSNYYTKALASALVSSGMVR